MARCDRCHHKFATYAALAQHYRAMHANATLPAHLESMVDEERERKAGYEAIARLHGPSRLKLTAFLLIVVIAVGVIGYVAFAPKLVTEKKVIVGAAAPDFSLPTINGGTFKLSDYLGRSNVLLFFHEGLACAPCLTQMQGLDGLDSQFVSMKVVVVSITGDSVSLMSQWVKTSGMSGHQVVLSDQSLQVSRSYEMLGADVSMMPGTAPGHSFVLVNTSGVIVWRADYGPYNMSVPNNQIIAACRQALGA